MNSYFEIRILEKYYFSIDKRDIGDHTRKGFVRNKAMGGFRFYIWNLVVWFNVIDYRNPK